MTPDYERAAIKAAEMLIKHNICTAPVIPLPVFKRTPGCYERCLQGMRKTPAVHVPAELNRKIREQFSDYISNFLDFESYLSQSDESMLVNLGTYMDGYEE